MQIIIDESETYVHEVRFAEHFLFQLRVEVFLSLWTCNWLTGHYSCPVGTIRVLIKRAKAEIWTFQWNIHGSQLAYFTLMQ